MEELPDIPEKLSQTQCVYFSPDEIIICGGIDSRNCYSYHIKEQLYRYIGSYPRNVQILGHTVVSYLCPDHYFNSSDDTNIPNDQNSSNNVVFALLSFGGNKEENEDLNIIYHTLMMRYESVWDDENENENEKEKKKKEEIKTRNFINLYQSNEWIPLPNQLKFGEKQRHDLCGARAAIGGSQKRHLLFITHRPKQIDVIDLSSFQYLQNVKNTILPLSRENEVWYHCFVSILDINKKNKKDIDVDEFILISNGETLLIRYDAINYEFFYQQLSFLPSSYASLHSYGFVYLWRKNCILIFGGFIDELHRPIYDIWKFDMKKKYWRLYDSTMPKAITNTVAVMDESDSSVHIIGGAANDSEDQKIHYVINIPLTEEEIEKIIQYWIRKIRLKLGWIHEFDIFILNYITRKYEKKKMKKKKEER